MKLIRKIGGIPLTILLIFALLINIVSYKDLLKTIFYPVIKHVEKDRMLRNVDDYQVYETEHFNIRFDNGDIEIARLTGDIAEKYYDKVVSMFDYSNDDKVELVIYDEEKTLLDNTKLKKENAPLGVYYSGVINILSPRNWIEDSSKLASIYETDGPVIHEFVHYIIDDITKGNYPMWLTEGIALYTEYNMTGFEWGKGVEYNEVVEIETLNSDFYSVDQSLAYRRSFEAVRDMSNIWGFDKINEILYVLGEGKSLNNTTRAVLKVNLTDLN